MFRSETIYRTSVLVPKNKVSDIIQALHKEGICQIAQANTALLPKEGVHEEEQSIITLAYELDGFMQLFGQYNPKQRPSLLSDLFKPTKKEPGKKQGSQRCYDIDAIETYLQTVEQEVREILAHIHSFEEKEAMNSYYLAHLAEIPEISTSMLKGTEHLYLFTGYVAHAAEFTQIQKKALVLTWQKEKRKLCICLCLRKEKDEIEAMLHRIGFDAIEIPYSEKTPSALIAHFTSENNSLALEKKEYVAKLEELYAMHYPALSRYSLYLQNEREKIEAKRLLASSDSFALLEAWVPKKSMRSLENILSTTAHHKTWVEQDDAPTLLRNPAIIKPFETVTELFSLPKYNNFDPTPLLAITFSLFFAFMMTDAVYGLTLLVFGILLFRGKGSRDQKAKNTAVILCIFGSLTFIMGLLFGSYFGDLLQQLGFNVPYLIDSLRQVLIVLILAISIGALHMLIGLMIGFVEALRKKQVRDAVQKQGVWILFVLSLALYAFGLILPASILLATSVILQVVLAYIEAGSIPAILSLISFPGFLGDIFSYARLTALALGSTGIALAVNFMSIMVWDTIPIMGPILAIIIFVIGHTFNMAMNGLGGFVHSIRLHFLEFFTKFYEGSGTKYIAFQMRDEVEL